MASRDGGSCRPGGRPKAVCGAYVVPTAARLKPEAEAELAACVQRGNGVLCRLLDSLTPCVTTSLQRVDCNPYSLDQIEPSIREGLEAALEEQCGELEPGRHVVESAVLRLRGTVAACIAALAPVDTTAPDGEGWAAERVTPELLEECFQGVPLDHDWAVLVAWRDALRRFVEANFYIVQAVANSFLGRGFDPEDLLQEGAIALRKAALRYVPGGEPFGPYARSVVRNHLTDLCRTARGLSAHIAQEVARFKTERYELAQRLGHAPSDEEVFAALGWSRTKRKNVEQALTSGQAHSLEVYEAQTGDLPEDELVEDPAKIAESNEDLNKMQRALEQLSDVERRIVQLRHQGPEILTQAETAERLRLSLHRVRTLEAGAIKKLRAPFPQETAAMQGSVEIVPGGPQTQPGAERSKRS
jgi:RNA polymerase sigma factor (sigma-70 family)